MVTSWFGADEKEHYVSNDQPLPMNMATLLSGEDQDNDVLKVEERYTSVCSDTEIQVLDGPGYAHSIILSARGIVTAGLITVYDSLTESGTVIWKGIFPVGSAPIVIPLRRKIINGIYVGYDGTVANVTNTFIGRADA